MFSLPPYTPPDFSLEMFSKAPTVGFSPVTRGGVAPDNYHATSVFPEYFQVRKGEWSMLIESRMDCAVVLEEDGSLSVKEFRHLMENDLVACGRRENGEDGIFVHTDAFDFPDRGAEKFSFRTGFTRETSFSIDYDELYQLVEFERGNGFILWVLGPAVVFDRDARNAFVSLVEKDYVHGLLAGNALPTHDVEGALSGTALGLEIYSKKRAPLGHYKHLDALNTVRSLGSLKAGVETGLINDGIMRAVISKGVPCVLAGSIRDDGPMPEVIGDVYRAQDEMRALARKATTVITLATQLHAIATGNMIPSYCVTEGSGVRPVYFYAVDMSEFAVSKLADRGSLTARAILTNVQDFIVTMERGLTLRSR